MRLLFLLLFTIATSSTFAQKVVEINIGTGTTKAYITNGPADSNKVVIINPQGAANATVVIKQGKNETPPFRILFGTGGIPIAKDTNIFRFDNNGANALFNGQKIKFPITVSVNNRTITDTLNATKNVTPPKGGTNGNGSDDDGGGPLEFQATKRPLYDALLLADPQCSDKTRENILSYYSFAAGSMPADSLRLLYKNNKFLADEISKLKKTGDQAVLESTGGAGLGSIFSSISGLDVTSIADGLAKFLVKRAKQELSMAFFDRFRDTLDSPKYADLRTVFPQTYAVLHSIGTDIYDYERYLQNLREAFKTDITTIYVNLPGIIKNHAQFFSAHKDWKAALLSACYVATELNNKTHPGDIIANYPVDYLDSMTSVNYKASIQTIQLISESLRDTATGDSAAYWASIGKVRELVGNKKAFKIYLGFVYQLAAYRYDSIVYEKTNLLSILNKAADGYDKSIQIFNAYKRYILGFGDKVDAIKILLQVQTASLSDSSKVVLYAKYFTSTVNLLDYSTQALDLPVIKDLVKSDTLVDKLQKYFTISYKAADLVTDINARNYSSAINNTIKIYRLITSTDSSSIPYRLVTALDAASITEQEKMVAVQNKLIYYGGFMASMATAKTSDDIETTIETYALPVGSSRIKRESKFNVSLNAYLGVFAGSEKIKGFDPCYQFNTWGVTAPIGVALSWGGKNKDPQVKNHSSYSLFFSVIDLGAVTAFRFNNDSTETVPSITIGDIISPGLFFSYGIPRTPLSVNLGYQAGPLLRNVTSTTNTYSNSYGRFSVSFCVDIPLLNLYTKNW